MLAACGPDPKDVAAQVRPMLEGMIAKGVHEVNGIYHFQMDSAAEHQSVRIESLTLIREDRHHFVGTATMHSPTALQGGLAHTETLLHVTVDGGSVILETGPISGVLEFAKFRAEQREFSDSFNANWAQGWAQRHAGRSRP